MDSLSIGHIERFLKENPDSKLVAATENGVNVLQIGQQDQERQQLALAAPDQNKPGIDPLVTAIVISELAKKEKEEREERAQAEINAEDKTIQQDETRQLAATVTNEQAKESVNPAANPNRYISAEDYLRSPEAQKEYLERTEKKVDAYLQKLEEQGKAREAVEREMKGRLATPAGAYVLGQELDLAEKKKEVDQTTDLKVTRAYHDQLEGRAKDILTVRQAFGEKVPELDSDTIKKNEISAKIDRLTDEIKTVTRENAKLENWDQEKLDAKLKSIDERAETLKHDQMKSLGLVEGEVKDKVEDKVEDKGPDKGPDEGPDKGQAEAEVEAEDEVKVEAVGKVVDEEEGEEEGEVEGEAFRKGETKQSATDVANTANGQENVASEEQEQNDPEKQQNLAETKAAGQDNLKDINQGANPVVSNSNSEARKESLDQTGQNVGAHLDPPKEEAPEEIAAVKSGVKGQQTTQAGAHDLGEEMDLAKKQKEVDKVTDLKVTRAYHDQLEGRAKDISTVRQAFGEKVPELDPATIKKNEISARIDRLADEVKTVTRKNAKLENWDQEKLDAKLKSIDESAETLKHDQMKSIAESMVKGQDLSKGETEQSAASVANTAKEQENVDELKSKGQESRKGETEQSAEAVANTANGQKNLASEEQEQKDLEVQQKLAESKAAGQDPQKDINQDANLAVSISGSEAQKESLDQTGQNVGDHLEPPKEEGKTPEITAVESGVKGQQTTQAGAQALGEETNPAEKPQEREKNEISNKIDGLTAQVKDQTLENAKAQNWSQEEIDAKMKDIDKAAEKLKQDQMKKFEDQGPSQSMYVLSPFSTFVPPDPSDAGSRRLMNRHRKQGFNAFALN